MDINENIRVGVVFTESNRPVPKWFIWQKRKYDIKEITYAWRSRIGDSPCIFFSVTDKKNVYEISFNQKSLKWKLASVSEAS